MSDTVSAAGLQSKSEVVLGAIAFCAVASLVYVVYRDRQEAKRISRLVKEREEKRVEFIRN